MIFSPCPAASVSL